MWTNEHISLNSPQLFSLKCVKALWSCHCFYDIKSIDEYNKNNRENIAEIHGDCISILITKCNVLHSKLFYIL